MYTKRINQLKPLTHNNTSLFHQRSLHLHPRVLKYLFARRPSLLRFEYEVDQLQRRLTQMGVHVRAALLANVGLQPLTRVDNMEPHVSRLSLLEGWPPCQQRVEEDTQ